MDVAVATYSSHVRAGNTLSPDRRQPEDSTSNTASVRHMLLLPTEATTPGTPSVLSVVVPAPSSNSSRSNTEEDRGTGTPCWATHSGTPPRANTSCPVSAMVHRVTSSTTVPSRWGVNT